MTVQQDNAVGLLTPLILMVRNEMSRRRSYMPYVLITPARNEGAFIEKTLRSMVRQTIVPVRWVIVNDGSTDATADIVDKYRAKHKWIQLVELPEHRDRSFAAKAYAFNAGYERVKDVEFELIGNLDADLSFDEEYCEFLLGKFDADPKLGVAGTIFEERGFSSATDSFEGQDHVNGGFQLFRRRCFEEIGGYLPNKAGGIDWIAVTTARMMGWKTRSFREKVFLHHRKSGTAARSVFAAGWAYGERDYYLGGHPVWELFRVAYRLTKKPYVIRGLALALGYSWALVRNIERPVSNELMEFHRREQMVKLQAIIRSALRLKRIESFHIMPR